MTLAEMKAKQDTLLKAKSKPGTEVPLNIDPIQSVPPGHKLVVRLSKSITSQLQSQSSVVPQVTPPGQRKSRKPLLTEADKEEIEKQKTSRKSKYSPKPK